MKKLVIFLLLSVIPFSFTACGSKVPAQQSALTNSPVAESATPAPTPTPVVEKKEEVIKAEVFAELDASVTAGILFDNNGHMLVGRDGGIAKIMPDGQVSFFCEFKDLPKGNDYFFKSPLVWDMVQEKDGSILAAAQDRVLRISQTGDITTLVQENFNGFLGASGIELDKEGNFYVTNGSKIIKYSTELEHSVYLDGKDVGAHTFFSLRFSPDYKTLYATDFNTSSLYQIPINDDGTAGTPVLIIKEPIKRAKPFGAPLNMVFSENGNLYCSLDCRWSLLKLDTQGNTEIVNMPRAGENHYIAFGGKGFDEASIYFTTYDGKKIYRYPLGEKALKK